MPLLKQRKRERRGILLLVGVIGMGDTLPSLTYPREEPDEDVLIIAGIHGFTTQPRARTDCSRFLYSSIHNSRLVEAYQSNIS